MRQNIDWPQRHELMIAKDEEHRLGIYLTRNLPQRLLIFFVAKAFVRTLLQKDPSVRAESAQALLHPVSIANIKIWDVFNKMCCQWFDEILNLVPLGDDDSNRPCGPEELQSTWPVIASPNQNQNAGPKRLRRRRTFPAYRKLRRPPRSELPGAE